MSLFSRLVVSVAQAETVEKTITKTRPGRALSRRFVAGETLEEAVEVARRLNDEGFLVSMDLLGEEVHDRQSAVQATEEYLDCLSTIVSLDANISIKLTQLGLAFDQGLAGECLDRLARGAAEAGTTVTVDMEDSRFTETTVRLYETAQRQHGNLGLALQACLHRTPADLERLIPLGGHIRLCKGAYLEPAEVAITARSQVTDAYASQLRVLMAAEGVRPAVATHDLTLVGEAKRLGRDRHGPFEFQMLYGVRPSLQKALVGEGYPLRVYLPFGSQWYPYLTRRLAERPANTWMFFRAVFGS